MPDIKISVERHFKRATWKLWGGVAIGFFKLFKFRSVCFAVYRLLYRNRTFPPENSLSVADMINTEYLH